MAIKKRPKVNWSPGAVPAQKTRDRSYTTPVTEEGHYNSLLPHLQFPGGLFSISENCVGSSVNVEGQSVLVILGPDHGQYATEPFQALPKGTPALHLGPTQLTYKNRGAQVNRLAHEFLITGRRWIISDLQWVQPSQVAEESEEE
jgi:hypothetical protein